jgi:hypothetical protein
MKKKISTKHVKSYTEFTRTLEGVKSIASYQNIKRKSPLILYPLGMGNAYPFNKTTLAHVLDKDQKMGNYALGKMVEELSKLVFRPYYIGRSDDDFFNRISDHLNEKTNYKFFKFRYHNVITQNYQHECRNFHLLVNSGNKFYNLHHPYKPSGFDVVCEVCDSFAKDS